MSIYLYLCLGILCNGVSMVVGLMFMFPNLEKLEKSKDSCDVGDKNLIFYGDIVS